MSGRRRLCDGCCEIFEKICDAGCCCCVSCICCTAVASEAVGSGDTTGASHVQAPRASRGQDHSGVKCPTAMLSRNDREVCKCLNDIFKRICECRQDSEKVRKEIRGDKEIHDMDKEELQKYVDLLVEEVSENIKLFQKYTHFVRLLVKGKVTYGAMHDLANCLEALKLGTKLQKLCDWETEAFTELEKALEPVDNVIPEIAIRSDYEKLLQQRRQPSREITEGSVVVQRREVHNGRVIFVETRETGGADILVAKDGSIIPGVDYQHDVVPDFPYENFNKYLKSSHKTYEPPEEPATGIRGLIMRLLNGTEHPSGRAPKYSKNRRLVAGADEIGPITSSAIAMGGIMLLGYIAYRVRRWRAKPCTTEEDDEPRPRHTVEFL